MGDQRKTPMTTLVESEGFCGVLIPLNWSWFPIWNMMKSHWNKNHPADIIWIQKLHLIGSSNIKWFKHLYLIDSKITLHNKLRYHKKNCTELLQPRFETRLFWSYWAIASKHHGVKRDGDGHMQLWWRGPCSEKWAKKVGFPKIYELMSWGPWQRGT